MNEKIIKKPRRLNPIQYPEKNSTLNSISNSSSTSISTTNSTNQPSSSNNTSISNTDTSISSPIAKLDVTTISTSTNTFIPTSPNIKTNQLLSPRTKKLLKNNHNIFEYLSNSPSTLSSIPSLSSPTSTIKSFPKSPLSGEPLPYDPSDPAHTYASTYEELPPLVSPINFEQHLSDSRTLASHRIKQHKKKVLEKQNKDSSTLLLTSSDTSSILSSSDTSTLLKLKEESNQEKIKLMKLRTNQRVEIYLNNIKNQKKLEEENKILLETEKNIKNYLYQNDELIKLRMKELHRETIQR